MRYVTKNLLLLALSLAAVGCAAWKGDGGKWKFAKALDPRRVVGGQADDPAEPQIPTRLIATWVDTKLHTPGQKPLRGFGGRVVFFGPEGQDSVRVDGELVVYAFDETDRSPHETQPTRRYIFPAEQFVKHESESQFGPSYSVWLPWDAVGGQQKQISLIARFEPRGGAMIVGEQTAHLLPGAVRPEQAVADAGEGAARDKGDIRLASFEDETDDAMAARRRANTTIELTPNLAARIARAKRQSDDLPTQRPEHAQSNGLSRTSGVETTPGASETGPPRDPAGVVSTAPNSAPRQTPAADRAPAFGSTPSIGGEAQRHQWVDWQQTPTRPPSPGR